MSFGGRAASSSGCATEPRALGTGSTDFVGRTGTCLRTGYYAMATAGHREPCESRGSCTVLGAPGGEIPLGDSTIASIEGGRTIPEPRYRSSPTYGHALKTTTNWPSVPGVAGLASFCSVT